MKAVWQIAVAVTLTVALMSGCGCIARRAVERATGVTASNDGKTVSITGEKGEKVTLETQKGDNKSGSLKVTTDQGTTTTDFGKDKVTEEQVGVVFYPGATVEGGGTVASSGKSTESLATVALLTDDPVSKVGAFYKDKYAKGNSVVEQGDMVMITVKGEKDAVKIITITADKSSGKTQIGIQSMSK